MPLSKPIASSPKISEIETFSPLLLGGVLGRLKLNKPNIAEAIETYKDLKIGLLTYNDILNDDAIAYKIVLSEGKNLEEAASKLYDALHQLDQQQLDIIIAEQLPDYGLGKSINDRLQRATK